MKTNQTQALIKAFQRKIFASLKHFQPKEHKFKK